MLRPDDLIFVRRDSYVDGPLLYYFAPPYSQFVGYDYVKTISERGQKPRVWVINYGDRQTHANIRTALTGYRMGPVLTAYKANATAYDPP